MAEKEEMENQLYERMEQENKDFIADLKTKTPDEIISHAYEVACRQDILMLFEDETSLSERQLATLLEFEHPLAELYADWINRDTDEMEHFRDSVISYANDILDNRAEEKYSNPNEPQYSKSREDAYACNEQFEWRANHFRNMECARAFNKGASDAYHSEQFLDFLQKWEAEYGKERCMFILSCTMAEREGDGRFYPPARRIAARFANQRELLGDRTGNYTNTAHSVIVNYAMEQLAMPERSKAQDKNQPKKKSQQQAR